MKIWNAIIGYRTRCCKTCYQKVVHKAGVDVDENEIDDNGNNINNSKTKASKSFKYKTKMAASTQDNINRLNAVVVVFSLIFLIKYLLFGDILICNWLTAK